MGCTFFSDYIYGFVLFFRITLMGLYCFFRLHLWVCTVSYDYIYGFVLFPTITFIGLYCFWMITFMGDGFRLYSLLDHLH